MDRDRAKTLVEEEWGELVAEDFECEVFIDDARTEEYDWGWAFYFLPRRLEECARACKMEAYALDRTTGESTPVGTKGLDHAVDRLQRIRDRAAGGGPSRATESGG